MTDFGLFAIAAAIFFGLNHIGEAVESLAEAIVEFLAECDEEEGDTK